MNEIKPGDQPQAEKKLAKCEDIQPLLFDYMSRELGEGRAAVVREHLRKCKACQALAKDMQATHDLLRKSSRAGQKPVERLTESRRNKIIWAFTHPVMNWIGRHRILASILITTALFIGVWAFMHVMLEYYSRPLNIDRSTARDITLGFGPPQTTGVTNGTIPAGR